MSKIFIQNPTGQNVGVQIVSNSDLQLINNGPDGAVVSEGNVVKICLSPDTENTDLPFNEGIINLDGEFVVQVNNEIIPYSFTANQLPHFFNGTRPECRGILFGKRSEEPVIIPAANEMYFVTTTGTFDFYGAAGDVITLSDGTTINITTDLTANIAVPTGKHKVTLTEVREDNYVGIGGEALTELVNFPTSSFITAIDFCPSEGNSVNLVKVPSILPSNISNTSFMFARCNSFNQDISMWDTSHVMIMVSMFNGATSFNQDLSQWCVPLIMKDPADFATGATLFTSDKFPVWGTCPRGENAPISSIVEPMLVTPSASTISISSVSDLEIDWGDGTIQTVKSGDDAALEQFGLISKKYTHTYTDSYIDKTISVKHVDGASPIQFFSSDAIKTVQRWYSEGYQPFEFLNAAVGFTQDMTFFGLGSQLETVPNTAPPKTNVLSGLFHHASLFNQDISGWDVSNVTSLVYTFAFTEAFNQPIGSWNVSNVTTLYQTFNNASAFNQPIGSWDVSNVTDMLGTFYNASTFNQPLNTWDTSNVTDMSYMFANASTFNQDLSQWCVGLISTMPGNFNLNGILAAGNHPVWGTCPRGENQV